MDAAIPDTSDFIWRSPGQWREFMMERYPGVDVIVPDGKFHTRYRAQQVGDVEFAEITSSSRQCIRVDAPRQESRDCFYLALQVVGDFHGGLGGQECHAGPQTFLLLDSRAPHWREMGPGCQLLNVRLPRMMIDRHLDDSAAAIMQPVNARIGQAAVAWEFAHSIWRRRDELGAGLPRMTALLGCMVASLFAVPANKGQTSSTVVFQRHRLLQCIDDQLRNPQFNVARAADCCGISRRYVHLLMQGTGRTFTRYLLERRLAECHDEIRATLGGRVRSLTDIAFSWGFNDIAHFSRAFRNHYGQSPREFRQNCKC